jgi:Protein of unknown function (DUF2796)
MRILFVLVLCLITSNSFAKGSKKKTEHRGHKAHVHGAGQLSIAFDGLKGRIELKLAAANILGFEHFAETDVDKAILENATNTFKEHFSKMVQFDATLGCVMIPDKVGQKMEKKKSKHSDFEASYNIECQKSVLNSNLKFNFGQYDQLKDIDVTILVDKLQKNLEISDKESSVTLK